MLCFFVCVCLSLACGLARSCDQCCDLTTLSCALVVLRVSSPRTLGSVAFLHQTTTLSDPNAPCRNATQTRTLPHVQTTRASTRRCDCSTRGTGPLTGNPRWEVSRDCTRPPHTVRPDRPVSQRHPAAHAPARPDSARSVTGVTRIPTTVSEVPTTVSEDPNDQKLVQRCSKSHVSQ